MEDNKGKGSSDAAKWLPWATCKSAKEVGEDLSKWMSQMTYAQTIEIHLKRCQGLVGADKSGTSDPYVKFHPGSKSTEDKHLKSTHKKKTCSPEWDETFVTNFVQKIYVEVFDWNRIHKDTPIGECVLDLWNDEEFTKGDFPTISQRFSVSRSLGGGKGTIELDIVPMFEPRTKSLLASVPRGIAANQSWPTYTFTSPDGECTVSVKLPNNFEIVKQYPAANWFGVAKTPVPPTPDGRIDTVVFGCKTKGKDQEGKFDTDQKYVKDYVMNLARIDAALLTRGNQPSKSLETEGVHVISGLNVGWYLQFVSHTRLDPQFPYSSVMTGYVFSAKGTLVEVSFSTLCDMDSESVALTNHQSKYATVWAPVLDSLVITVN